MTRQSKSSLSEIGKRLDTLMRKKGMNLQGFTKAIESNHTTVSNMMAGNNYSLASLEQVFIAFPDVDPQWILTGEGERVSAMPEQESLIQELKALMEDLETLKATHEATTTGRAFEALKKDVYRLLERSVDHRAKVLGATLEYQVKLLDGLRKMRTHGEF